jgi:glutathione S-transferase
MITLHAFGRVNHFVHGLTRDLRVQWALEELGLPYRVSGVDHPAGETRADAFGDLSPFHQIPVIEDDGIVLSESGAILVYLAEKAGQLADRRKKAEVLRWCFAALTTVEPPIAMIVLDDFGRKTDPVSREKRANLVKWAEQVLAGLERHLGEHPDGDCATAGAPRRANRNLPALRSVPAEVRSSPRLGAHCCSVREAARRGAGCCRMRRRADGVICPLRAA